MSLRPGRCYRKPHRPYTRVSISVPKKSFVVGVPASKIAQFEMGNKKKEFKKRLDLVSLDHVQIRHNALESARQAANKYLEKKLSAENYFLKLLVYPHQILRENPLATGAGADRFQQAMRLNFGKPIGRAAIVKKNQAIIMVRADASGVEAAKISLKRASLKLPARCRIILKDA